MSARMGTEMSWTATMRSLTEKRERPPEGGRSLSLQDDLPVRVVVVVGADLRAIPLLPVHALVELGRVLDLVLASVDDNRLRIEIDSLDHRGRKQDLLAEDPRAGVDDDVARADVVGSFVDLPDPAVSRLDLETGEVDPASHVHAKRVDVAVRPWFGGRRAFHCPPPWVRRDREISPRPIRVPGRGAHTHRVQRNAGAADGGAGGGPAAPHPPVTGGGECPIAP